MRHRVARNRWSLVGLALVTLLILAAIAAPWLAGDPTAGELSAALRSPSTANLLGTDAQGRDVLSRVLFGPRLSLAVGLPSHVIALTAGLRPRPLGARGSRGGGVCCEWRPGSRWSPGWRSGSPCWVSIWWATGCATPSTFGHDGHRVPPHPAACAARPVPRAACRGVSLDCGHRLPEQRLHRPHPGAHPSRARRVHRDAHGSAPPARPRAPSRPAGRTRRPAPAPERGAGGDRACDQHELRPEPRRAGAAPRPRRCRRRIGPRVSGERVSLAPPQEAGDPGGAGAVYARGLAR